MTDIAKVKKCCEWVNHLSALYGSFYFYGTGPNSRKLSIDINFNSISVGYMGFTTLDYDTANNEDIDVLYDLLEQIMTMLNATLIGQNTKPPFSIIISANDYVRYSQAIEFLAKNEYQARFSRNASLNKTTLTLINGVNGLTTVNHYSFHHDAYMALIETVDMAKVALGITSPPQPDVADEVTTPMLVLTDLQKNILASMTNWQPLSANSTALYGYLSGIGEFTREDVQPLIDHELIEAVSTQNNYTIYGLTQKGIDSQMWQNVI